MGKNSGILSEKSVLKRLGVTTQKNLRITRTKLRMLKDKGNASKKYSKSSPARMLWFKEGYDLLEYSIVVKPYIYKKYKIKNSLILDSLLYLFPKQYFTAREFKLLPIEQHNLFLKNFVDMGFVEISIPKTFDTGNVYTITELTSKIVREYYQYLSGEKTITPTSYTNPFKGLDATKADKKRERLMVRLKHQSEMNPDHFRKGLYTPLKKSN